MKSRMPHKKAIQPKRNGAPEPLKPLKEARDHFEKSYLEYHFEKNGGSVAKLASAIGMERTHLYRKLHSLKIKL